VAIVTVAPCHRCDVAANAFLEHARRAAMRVLADRGIIAGGAA